jgi:hypothetical protein
MSKSSLVSNIVKVGVVSYVLYKSCTILREYSDARKLEGKGSPSLPQLSSKVKSDGALEQRKRDRKQRRKAKPETRGGNAKKDAAHQKGHDGDILGQASEGKPTGERVQFSPEEVLEWLTDELKQKPVYTLYPEIAEKAKSIFASWSTRFDPRVWARFTRRGRVVKELNECAPVINTMLNMMQTLDLPPNQRLTIVDLCSGFGFLGMFLAEMLPPEKVAKIVLVDRMWPMREQTMALPNQICWDHILSPGWHIPLETRKADIRKPHQMKQFDQYVMPPAAGPAVVLAVHLCGTLSLRAVQLFNTAPQVYYIGAMLFLYCC